MKQAVILIAGGGTRLGAQTVARPKCMLEVQGKSLLARMLTYLNRAGIKETILVVGYQADLVRRHIGQQWEACQSNISIMTSGKRRITWYHWLWLLTL